MSENQDIPLPVYPINTQPIEKQDNNLRGMLMVNSIFHTIQGEGPFQGMPAVFVRLAGCNLQCPACFGIAVKGRIPYLTKSFGPSTRLDRIREGDVLLTYDKDFNLVETMVTKTLQRKVDEWLEIQIDGMKYDVTPDHPFFTTRGLLSAEELEVGDFILDCRPEEVISFKKKGDRNPIHDPETMKRKLHNTNYTKMGRKVQKITKQFGELPVFNISCSPYPTYLANGMWVHNCDTEYTKRTLYSPLNIANEVRSYLEPGGLIVLTGGEPFRQNIGPAVTYLLNLGFAIQVETNGTLGACGPFPWSKVSIVCSPKTPILAPTIKVDYWKYVLDADNVAEEDGLPTSVMGCPTPPARPNNNAPVYVQPMDAVDPETNAMNMQAAVFSCMKFGYRLCVQIHKLGGMP